MSESKEEYFRKIEEDGRAASESEKPLVAAIQKAGWQVNSVWDLVNFHENYPELIPILSENLNLEYHPKVKIAIVRALIEKCAIREDVSKGLVMQLRSVIERDDVPWDALRQSIVYALTKIGHSSVSEELQELSIKLQGTYLASDMEKAIRLSKRRK